MQVICFINTIKQSHLTSTSLIEALEKRRTGRRFLLSLWEFFYGADASSDDISLEDRKRVPVFLSNAQQQLIEIFQVGQVLTNPLTPMFKNNTGICPPEWPLSCLWCFRLISRIYRSPCCFRIRSTTRAYSRRLSAISLT